MLEQLRDFPAEFAEPGIDLDHEPVVLVQTAAPIQPDGRGAAHDHGHQSQCESQLDGEGALNGGRG